MLGRPKSSRSVVGRVRFHSDDDVTAIGALNYSPVVRNRDPSPTVGTRDRALLGHHGSTSVRGRFIERCRPLRVVGSTPRPQEGTHEGREPVQTGSHLILV